jgi:hypothetical protein
VNRVDTTIRVAAGVTVIGLAGIAGAISYSRMTELAGAHGEHGWRTHMFPLSVGLIEVVASLVLLADKRAGRRSCRLPWAALVAGTAASFAANVAVAGSDWIGRAVSGWPAFALLTAVKLLFGLLDHPTATTAANESAVPVPTQNADTPVEPGTVRVPADADPDGAHDPAGDWDEPRTGPADADGHHVIQSNGKTNAASARAARRVRPTISSLDVSPLMTAARAARATLVHDGRTLTREALARQLRTDGHAASNARVSALLKALAAESLAAEDARTTPLRSAEEGGRA